jgi:hypothetical protein
MPRYNAGSTATLDDTANALLLRTDLHIAFDKPRIAFERTSATNSSTRLVAHLLDYSPVLEHLLSQSQAAPHRNPHGHAVRILRMVRLHTARCILRG